MFGTDKEDFSAKDFTKNSQQNHYNPEILKPAQINTLSHAKTKMRQSNFNIGANSTFYKETTQGKDFPLNSVNRYHKV
jgi:hypothetical protein